MKRVDILKYKAFFEKHYLWFYAVYIGVVLICAASLLLCKNKKKKKKEVKCLCNDCKKERGEKVKPKKLKISNSPNLCFSTEMKCSRKDCPFSLPCVVVLHGAVKAGSHYELGLLGDRIVRLSGGRCCECSRARRVYVPSNEDSPPVHIGGPYCLQAMTNYVRMYLFNKQNGKLKNGEKFILIGYSLGGLVGRCALMDSPNEHPDRRTVTAHNCIKFVSLASPQTGFRQGTKAPATWGAEHFTVYRKDITRHLSERDYLKKNKFLKDYNNEERVYDLEHNGVRILGPLQAQRKENFRRIPRIYLFGGEKKLSLSGKVRKVIDPWHSQMFGYAYTPEDEVEEGKNDDVVEFHELEQSRIYKEDLVGLNGRSVKHRIPTAEDEESEGKRFLYVYMRADKNHSWWKEEEAFDYIIKRVFPELVRGTEGPEGKKIKKKL